MAVKKILSVKVSDLTLDPNNARKHGESDVAAIAASLDKFGQQTPIVITSDNVVIKGNGTLMAAMKLTWTHIEAIRTSLTGQQITAYAIADNRTSDLSEFDNEKLLELLQGLDEQSLIDACGFDEAAMAELLGDKTEVPEELDNEEQFIDQTFKIIIECETEQLQSEALEKLIQEGYSCKSIVI